MIKKLMTKEVKLSWHETSYIFLVMTVMFLIPNYPLYIAFFFPCLGIFYMFLNGREQNDLYFSALLPVSKRDIVKARFLSVISIQLLQILLSIPFALLRNKVLLITNLAGIEANPGFYGLVFLMFAVFNVIFLPLFYKSTDKVGAPFLIAGVIQFLFIIICEALIFIIKPLGEFLDTTAPEIMRKQLPVLLTSMLLYLLITGFSYYLSAKSFEKLDL